MLARVGIALGLLAGVAGATPFVVHEPTGWREDAALEHAITERAQLGGLQVHAYHPDGAPTAATFMVLREEVDAVRGVDSELAAIQADEAAAGSSLFWSSQRAGRGQVAADVEYVRRTGVELHVHVVAADTRTGGELLLASCAGTGAYYAACDRAVAAVSIPSDAKYTDDDDTGLWTLVGGLFGVAIGAGLIFGLVRAAIRRRDLRTSGALVDHELVTITGTVAPVHAPLMAPLSGRPCVLHRSRARLFTLGRDQMLVAEPSDLEATAFVIETPRGPVLVDTNELVLELTPESVVVGRSQSRELAFLQRHGFGPDRHPGTGFDEIVIAPGTTVTARGMIRIERDQSSAVERGYRDDVPAHARLVSAGERAVTILRAW